MRTTHGFAGLELSSFAVEKSCIAFASSHCNHSDHFMTQCGFFGNQSQHNSNKSTTALIRKVLPVTGDLTSNFHSPVGKVVSFPDVVLTQGIRIERHIFASVKQTCFSRFPCRG